MYSGKVASGVAFLAFIFTSITILANGCGKIGRGEDFSYLTPIPQSTIDAYEYSQPIETRKEAVIAARKFAFTFHMHWVGKPKVIFVEKMRYQDARQRTKLTNETASYDPTPPESPVWLVIFEGQYTITAPLGVITGPYTGCGYALLFAETGEPKSEGGRPCEDYRLDKQ